MTSDAEETHDAGSLRGRPSPVMALTGAVVAAWVGYSIWLGLGPHHGITARDTWLSDAILLGASVIAILRSIRAADRLAWTLVGAGMALWAIGDTLFSVWVQNLSPVPSPSPADPFYLVFYPLMYLGLVLLVRRRITRFHSSVLLDGLIVALSVGAFGSLTVRAVVDQGSSDIAGAVVNAAYPVGDLLLLIIGLGSIALVGWRAGRAWIGLVGGCVAFTVADTIYLLQGSSYHPGTLLDAGWPAAMILFALSSRAGPPAGERVRFEGISLLVLPGLAALASIAFLVAATRVNLPVPGVVLASAALLAVVLRTGISFRQVSALAETRRQALTDELTGLANRRRLYLHLDTLLEDGSTPEGFAVVLLDLDRFKEINDALGHGVGDELLCQLGNRLSAGLRDGDLLARLGGDEFALVLGPGSDAASATTVVERLLESLQAIFTLTDVSIHIDASLGIAVYPEHAATRSELMRCADVAMYSAKRSRTRFAVYELADDTNNRDRLLRIEQLREAIGSEQLICYYQPKLVVATGQVMGAEALLRWQHPTRGLLQPGEFLPLAEQTGLMGELTLEVLNQALAQCARWRQGGHLLVVAVNLSTTNLLDSKLPTQVSELLALHGLGPEALELEITEDTLMADPTGARLVLEALRDIGVGLSVDDYGTGYSSLAYLQDLPVDELKLDRTFITGVASRPRARSIVEATVALAGSLGLRLVAEGVETEEDWAELVTLGVDLAQGYWMSRPQHPDAFAGWLAVPSGWLPSAPTRASLVSSPG